MVYTSAHEHVALEEQQHPRVECEDVEQRRDGPLVERAQEDVGEQEREEVEGGEMQRRLHAKSAPEDGQARRDHVCAATAAHAREEQVPRAEKTSDAALH
eukprot:scaffold1574_cov119-Isochrysis_galbana.AAC.3